MLARRQQNIFFQIHQLSFRTAFLSYIQRFYFLWNQQKEKNIKFLSYTMVNNFLLKHLFNPVFCHFHPNVPQTNVFEEFFLITNENAKSFKSTKLLKLGQSTKEFHTPSSSAGFVFRSCISLFGKIHPTVSGSFKRRRRI